MELNRTNVNGLQLYPEKVLQFGEGNFLRAFVDWMIYKMNKEIGFNAGVTVVQPIEKGIVHLLEDQDGLYHLYLQGIKNGQTINERLMIDCLQKFVNPYNQFDEYQKSILNSELRFVVSNTTEAGITMDANDTLDMKPQNSFPGKMTALLYNRFKHFNGDSSKGLIIICCELIENNGDALKNFVVKHAHNWGLESAFIDWLNSSCAFCSSLVDRIVPGFPKDQIQEIHKEIGYIDNLVVMSEIFHVWVIKAPEWVRKEFPADKAALNVVFADDISVYRDQKVRILNGTHTATYALAYLSSKDTVLEALNDEKIGAFVNGFIYDEVCPNIKLPQDKVKATAKDILERFYNPFIKHQWMSIALNAMSKWETRVQPTLIDYQKRTGELPHKTVFSLAAMIAFYRGIRNNEIFKANDSADVLELYTNVWKKYDGYRESIKSIVKEVLAYKPIFKQDLNEIPGLTELTTNYLYAIVTNGAYKALDIVLTKENNQI